MSIEIPLGELNQQATTILAREIGIADTLRSLSQFSNGSGDYTKEREQWLGDFPVEQITSEIKAKRNRRA